MKNKSTVANLDVSIIIPVFNERDNLRTLAADIMKTMSATGKGFEVIFVNDGSTDDSLVVLEELFGSESRIKVIDLKRNYGQTAAISAGFDYASGKILITLDADNQNDPADIPMLVKKLEEGYDVVSGWRRERKDPLISRRLPSAIANRLLSFVTGVRLKDYGCTLKAYRAECVGSFELYGEMHRFLPALAGQAGAKIVEVPVNHRPRTKGRTKYGPLRTFKVVMDLITVKFLGSFATKPSYLFGGMGMTLCFAGILCAIEVLIAKFVIGTYAHRNPVLLLAVFCFLLGVQFVFLGLIAELLVRTYHESQGKPIYLVRRTLNFN